MAEINLITTKGGIKRLRGTSEGLAMVRAISLSGEESAAHDGNAYIVHGHCHTAAATSGGLMYIKNTSATDALHIGRIYIDPGVLTPTDMFLSKIINPTTTTGGTDTTASGVVQKNTGKTNALATNGLILKISDAASDFTYFGGNDYHHFPVASRTSIFRDMKGTNVIGPGGEWLLGWESAGGATDAEIIHVSVNLYVSVADPE